MLIATLFAAARFLLPLVYQDCTDLPPTVREREKGEGGRDSPTPRWHTYPSLTNTNTNRARTRTQRSWYSCTAQTASTTLSRRCSSCRLRYRCLPRPLPPLSYSCADPSSVRATLPCSLPFSPDGHPAALSRRGPPLLRHSHASHLLPRFCRLHVLDLRPCSPQWPLRALPCRWRSIWQARRHPPQPGNAQCCRWLRHLCINRYEGWGLFPTGLQQARLLASAVQGGSCVTSCYTLQARRHS